MADKENKAVPPPPKQEERQPVRSEAVKPDQDKKRNPDPPRLQMMRDSRDYDNNDE